MDDMGEWAEPHPITQRAHRALPRCTGMCDSGRRDCSCPTGRPMPAEACTEVGTEDQFESADREVLLWLGKGFLVLSFAIGCAVAIVRYGNV